jgi:hypothetical protein
VQDEEVEALMKHADVNGDNHINYPEVNDDLRCRGLGIFQA